MTDVSIEELGRAPLHQLELWGSPQAAARRLAAVLGHDLPRAGHAQGVLLRTGPSTWLVEGDCAALRVALGDDGSLVAVGGGLVRVRLSGPGWRNLLMEGGLFDAESPDFGIDRVATTQIDHVTVILRVESDRSCLAFVPASLAADLLRFWRLSADGLPQ